MFLSSIFLTLPLPYRLTRTLRNQRKEHNDWLGCQIIGEDPATTILRWDGEPGKWMWGLDMWYGKLQSQKSRVRPETLSAVVFLTIRARHPSFRGT